MIDLDAAKAARRETLGEAPVVIWQGATFELPVELPFDTGEALLTFLEDTEAGAAAVFADVRAILRPLLGARFEEFMAGHPAMGDLIEFMRGLPQEYGFTDLGESVASERSSTTTSRPQKPRSERAMAST